MSDQLPLIYFLSLRPVEKLSELRQMCLCRYKDLVVS